jgi:hypothetical protein
MSSLPYRARLLRPRVFNATRVHPRSNGPAAVEQLADDMRYAKSRFGNVTRDDMSLLGWRWSQLDEHESAARELAYALEGGVYRNNLIAKEPANARLRLRVADAIAFPDGLRERAVCDESLAGETW